MCYTADIEWLDGGIMPEVLSMKRVIALLCLMMICLAGSAGAEAFQDFGDACAYVRQEAGEGAEQIEFSVPNAAVHGREWWEIRDVLTDVLEYCESYSISYRRADGRLYVTINCVPRASLRMLDAWETGDWSALSADERVCLELAAEAAAQCREGADSAIEVELAVYDYICERVAYAGEAVEKGPGTPEYLRASTAVGALVDGLAQCQGYAEAFYLVGRLAGLEVETQYGWGGAGSPGKHAWNVVRIGRDCWMVDVCWGDTGADVFELTTPNYVDFNAGLDRMPVDRRWHPEAEVMPVNAQTNPARTAFDEQHGWGRTCMSLNAALEYAIDCHNAGKPYAHIFLPYRYTLDQVDSAMWQKVQAARIRTTWGRMTYDYAGGTYLIIRWVLE